MTEQVLTVTLTKYIETRIFGDRPHIRGHRIPVATIVYSARANEWGIQELAYQYTLSEAEILAALLYYKEHAEEIDAQEQAEYEAFMIEYEKQQNAKKR